MPSEEAAGRIHLSQVELVVKLAKHISALRKIENMIENHRVGKLTITATAKKARKKTTARWGYSDIIMMSMMEAPTGETVTTDIDCVAALTAITATISILEEQVRKLGVEV